VGKRPGPTCTLPYTRDRPFARNEVIAGISTDWSRDRQSNGLAPGHCLEIRTYKRNRLVRFQRLGQDGFLVVRDGFEQDRFQVGADKLKKTLRALLKQEFPRSAKIRVFDLGPCDPDVSRGMKRL
jgi:hypothetical protein